jgi:hypothetical protein
MERIYPAIEADREFSPAPTTHKDPEILPEMRAWQVSKQ